MKNRKGTISTIFVGVIILAGIMFLDPLVFTLFGVLGVLGLLTGALVGKKLDINSKVYNAIIYINAVSWFITGLGIFVATLTIGLTFYNQGLNTKKLNLFLIINIVLTLIGIIWFITGTQS